MKAVLLNQFGGPENLSFGDFNDPVPLDGEVVVRVRACALNHLDLWVRQGVPAYRIRLPHILGSDIAGEIHSVGPGVDVLKPGDRVFLAPGVSCFKCEPCLAGRDNLCDSYGVLGAQGGHGGYAQFVKVPARNALPLPDRVSFEEGAAFPLTFVTAWHMLVTRAALRPGQTVLVLGAGSGIGVAAIQVARHAGADVIALSTQESKLGQAKKLGASETILGGGDFSRQVLKLTQGRGVDVVFEHVGPATFDSSVRSLKKGGTLVTCGATTGPKTELDLRYVFSRELNLLGSYMGTLGELSTVAALVGTGKLKVVVDSTRPLSEARQAHEYLAAGKQFGKVVLIP